MNKDHGQDLAIMRDIIPRVWWTLYQGALQAGFDPIQSFALVQTWILSQNPSGIRPNGNAGPDSDTE